MSYPPGMRLRLLTFSCLAAVTACGCRVRESSRIPRTRMKRPAQTSERMQEVGAPPYGSVIYTIGVLESQIGGSTFWVLPGLCGHGGTDTSRPGMLYITHTGGLPGPTKGFQESFIAE